MAPADARVAEMGATFPETLTIVLAPISHPELGDIVIEDNLFAIGRTEAPFAAYRPELVGGLSRRHARIFAAYGGVYIADLESKNGTTVNGVNVREKPHSLRHGDEIRFGEELSYRVRLGVRATAPERAARLHSLTLTPQRADLGLQPIVLTRFPFLITKADDIFARYTDVCPQQVSYISRRHAHIFVKGATPFIEDLGSTNGTFVGGKRLEEHAVPLDDGDVVGFGGKHFQYTVTLEKVVEDESTVTKMPLVAARTGESCDNEKTTFVASAASFLDIFCVDSAATSDDAINNEGLTNADAVKEGGDDRRERGRLAILLSAVLQAFAGERANIGLAFGWASALVAVLAVAGVMLYLIGASERELKELFASREYVRVATAASGYLARNPDNAEIKALHTEALLKAKVPQWLSRLKAGDFDQAHAALADIKSLGGGNADVQSFASELEWMGELEQFVVGRGGVDAPIRIYADEERMKTLLGAWNEDRQRHQRAFATISSFVPEFRDAYAETLSRLRKLQNDDSVHLAAIERLKAAIGTELDRDAPDALDAVLKEYSEKYPRLGGLDAVRADLRQYAEIEKQVRTRKLGRLVALLAKAQFSTPPFQAKFRALVAGDRFPPAELLRQYELVSKAWRQGDAKQAIAGLQKMGTGPWADAAAREFERKKTILEQFAALQAARGGAGYEERLLTFYGSLEPDEDLYFMRATEADVGVYKDGALARAQESIARAEALWLQYRDHGAIEGRERLQAAISSEFRAQARLLAEANDSAQQGIRIYGQLKMVHPAPWTKLRDEIKAELEQQRSSLVDLRHVVEPGLLRARLALLGGSQR